MGAVYYDFKISDSLIKKELLSQNIDFDNKELFSRTVKDANGIVTVSFTDVGTAKVLFLTSTKSITLEINGQDVLITDFIFMTLESLTSLKVSCSDASGAFVEAVIWGVN